MNIEQIEKAFEENAFVLPDFNGHPKNVFDKDTFITVVQELLPKWISVKERLPELIKDQDYSKNVFAICNNELLVMAYCLVPDDDGNWGYVWCNCHGDINGDAEFDDNYDVTHWMPLPEKLNQ